MSHEKQPSNNTASKELLPQVTTELRKESPEQRRTRTDLVIESLRKIRKKNTLKKSYNN